jgi:hypothetical protein
MFSKVTIGTADFDLGAVCEALIYYGQTALWVNGGSIAQLTKELGYENVIRALELGALKLRYNRSLYAVHTQTNAKLQSHRFVRIHVEKSEAGEVFGSSADEIEYHFKKSFGNSTETISKARALAGMIEENSDSEDVILHTKDDIRDKEYVTNAVRGFLQAVVPEYTLPANLRFQVVHVRDDDYCVLTNLNLVEISRAYNRRIPTTHSTISEAWILSHIFDARRELDLSAIADSDLWVSDPLAAVIQKRVTTAFDRTNSSKEDIEYFHKVEFEKRTFRDAINDKARTGSDLLDFLEAPETLRFKQWLAAQEPDANLLKEYDRQVFSRHSWIDRIPVKFGKWVVFSAIGLGADALIGTGGLGALAAGAASVATDVAVSAGDDLISSKIGRGWKPNQFIEGPAKKFLAAPTKRA